MKKIKKPTWLDEFKTFAIKGNAMALAVGTIIGAAYLTCITDCGRRSINTELVMNWQHLVYCHCFRRERLQLWQI